MRERVKDRGRTERKSKEIKIDRQKGQIYSGQIDRQKIRHGIKKVEYKQLNEKIENYIYKYRNNEDTSKHTCKNLITTK